MRPPIMNKWMVATRTYDLSAKQMGVATDWIDWDNNGHPFWTCGEGWLYNLPAKEIKWGQLLSHPFE